MDEIKQLEAKLMDMGAKCALLTISPENVEERLKSRNPEQWKGQKNDEMKKAYNSLLKQQQEKWFVVLKEKHGDFFNHSIC